MRIVVALLWVVGCVEPGTVRRGPVGLGTGMETGIHPGETGIGTGVGADDTGPCEVHMALIEGPSGPFCIDRYEASLENWSPYDVPTGGQVATVAPGRIPQGYISGDAAAEACTLAGKRLCAVDEWLRACQGPEGTLYPYGDEEDPEACNTSRASHPVVDLFGAATDWSPDQMNDPRINQQPDTVDAGGANPDCVSADGVYDLHGNLHEWIDDPDGTFKGGFYADASINGPGCTYRTTAHSMPYHDYSTGFRCCAEAL